jgi:threonyl-tRNA synthetase
MNLEDNPKLYTIRHSLAHILAQAVQQKYPGTKLGFGPPTREGFYYDFDFPGDAPGEKDLKDIEKSMRKIIYSGQTFERIDGDYDAAKKVLSDYGDEPFKQENLDNLKDRGVAGFSFYKNGEFLDVLQVLIGLVTKKNRC